MTAQDILNELQGLDANNVGSWPFYVYVSACILLFLLTIGGGYYQFAIPKLEALERARVEEKALRVDFEKKQKKVASLDAYRKQLAEMEKSFAGMLRQLPSKAEVANLLNDISQTRVASGLEEDLFQPVSEVRKEFYSELPNTIHITGGYHDLAMFVSRVSALPRIVTINDVNIKPTAKSNSTSSLTMKAAATTYRYLDEEAVE